MKIDAEVVHPLGELCDIMGLDMHQRLMGHNGAGHRTAEWVEIHSVPLVDSEAQVAHGAVGKAAPAASSHDRERCSADPCHVVVNGIQWDIKLVGLHKESVCRAVEHAPKHIEHIAPQDNINPRRSLTHVHQEGVGWGAPLQTEGHLDDRIAHGGAANPVEPQRITHLGSWPGRIHLGGGDHGHITESVGTDSDSVPGWEEGIEHTHVT